MSSILPARRMTASAACPVSELNKISLNSLSSTMPPAVLQIIAAYSEEGIPLAAVLLSDRMIKRVNSYEEMKVLAIVKMIVKNAQEALKIYSSGTLTGIDPLCGDFGCERNALANLYVQLRKVRTEMRDKDNAGGLVPQLNELTAVVNRRGSAFGNYNIRKQVDRRNLIDMANAIVVSQDMACLLQTQLVTATKQTYMGKDGKEKWRTDISLIDKNLAKGVPAEIRRAIVGEASHSISSLYGCSTS